MIALVARQPHTQPIQATTSCSEIFNRIWTAVRDFFLWIKSFFCSTEMPLPAIEDPNTELNRRLARYNNLPMGDPYLSHAVGLYTQTLFPPKIPEYYANLPFYTPHVARLAVQAIVLTSDNLDGQEPLPFMRKNNQLPATPLGIGLDLTSPVPFSQALKLQAHFRALPNEEKRLLLRHLHSQNIDNLPLTEWAKNLLKGIQAIGEDLVHENPAFQQALLRVR
jgi:hypothetical protein